MKQFLRKLDREEQRLLVVTLLLALFVSVSALDIMMDGVVYFH